MAQAHTLCLSPALGWSSRFRAWYASLWACGGVLYERCTLVNALWTLWNGAQKCSFVFLHRNRGRCLAHLVIVAQFKGGFGAKMHFVALQTITSFAMCNVTAGMLESTCYLHSCYLGSVAQPPCPLACSESGYNTQMIESLPSHQICAGLHPT